MLVKVKFLNSKKFLRLQDGFTYADFINEVQNKFGLPHETILHFYDDSETEVDEDVLQELLQAKPDMMLTIRDRNEGFMAPDALSSLSSIGLDRPPVRLPKKSKTLMVDLSAAEAKEVVLAALKQKAGGDAVLAEYSTKNMLSSETRRVLVNILVEHMIEMHGRIPTRNQREQYALGVVTLFPLLRDPFSKKGYEHFYDAESGTGYLAWRLKTVQRNTSQRATKRSDPCSGLGGPSLKRSTNPEGHQLDEDAVREDIAFLAHSSDEAQIFLKMKETFHHRHGLVHDPDRTADALKIFPRFLDTKGLINQDFTLLFNAETASRMLERWDTAFKPRIIEEAMGLTLTPPVRSLLLSAKNETDSEDLSNWDSDMATLLLLIHLLPPPPGGKRAAKISAAEAADRLVVYHKSCSSIDEHLWKRGRQPYLLAVGRSQGQIDNFYIAVSNKLIPCQGVGSLSAFDELFKAHFVFNLTYDDALFNFYTFIQTTIYKIDVGKTKESPRVKELRAKLLNNDSRMLSCFKCQALYTNSQSLLTHLRFDHGFCPNPKSRLIRAQETCRTQFTAYSGFRNLDVDTSLQVQNYLESNSSLRCDLLPPDGPSGGIDFDEFTAPNSLVDESLSDTGNFETSGSILPSGNIKNTCAAIVAKLQGSGAASNVVASVVCDLEEFTNEMHAQMKYNVLALFPARVPWRTAVEQNLEDFENPFTCLNTDDKRARYFNENCKY